MHILVAALTLAVLFPGGTVLAQAPPESPPPSPKPDAGAEAPPSAEGPADKAGSEGEPAVEGEADATKADEAETAPPAPGEIRVRAGTQEQLAKGHFKLRGFVDLEAGDVRIQADDVDVFMTERPDGTQSRRIEAVGNVVFIRGEERLSGERLTMDLDTGKGRFEQALGYVQPGVFIEGKTIERVDADTYRVQGGRFTSCYQTNPRWDFAASSATIDVDDKIIARNVVFRVKRVPALYLPVIYYPIRSDQRSTGFLFPHFGYSSTRGFNVGSGFFWAMGRSYDQTFYVDHYSKFGYGLGHELRYMLPSPSRGTFRSYGFRPTGIDTWDYDLDWNAVQTLPGAFRATVNVRQYSNLLFQERFQDNLNLATTRTKRASFSLQQSFRGYSFTALADANDTYFGETIRVNRRLPSIRFGRSQKKIGRTGIVLGFDSRAETLEFGQEGDLQKFSRFDIAPELSRPIAVSWLQVNPRLQFRYTRYTSTQTDDGITGPGLDRPYLESDVELRGPTFSRVFNRPGGFYTDKVKHTIGPEVTWRYRTAVEDFELIPKFDGLDYLLGTHQVDYALVQRFLAKRPGPGGKTVPYEFLSWRIGQTYYVQINEGQNEFDPNYSSSAFGPGGRPDHNSPIQSRVRLRPTPSTNADFNLEYDVNFKQLRSLGLATRWSGSWGMFQGSWSRASRLAEDPEARVRTRDTLRGSTRLALLPGRLNIEGSADYDLVRKHLVQSSSRLRYDVQCCGFMVEMIRYNFNSRSERQFRFSIELANIGSMGNFMGDESRRSGASGIGFNR